MIINAYQDRRLLKVLTGSGDQQKHKYVNFNAEVFPIGDEKKAFTYVGVGEVSSDREFINKLEEQKPSYVYILVA